MLEGTFSSPIFNALALTLIHFLWQGVLIAGVLKILLLFISKQASLVRYSLSCFAMIISLIVPVLTFFWCYQFYSPDAPVFSFNQSLLLGVETVKASQEIQSSNWSQLSAYLPYISLVWFSVVIVLTAKLFVELYVLSKLPYQRTLPVENALQTRFNQLVEQLKLKQSPRLVISLTVDVPMAMGWLKPVVLLPANMLTGLSTAQLEMLILHELAHIRRHDYLVNFLQTLVEILLFFHPAVTWMSKQMRQEREHCSDDIAVAHCGNAVAYAHTLADTASLCSKHRHATIPTMAMAASGGDLKQRVVRLIDHQCTNNTDAGRWFAGAMLGLSLLVIMSKQFLSVPQLNLTVGEISLFTYYNKFAAQEPKHNQQSMPQKELLETTIAQQLVTKQHPLTVQHTNNQFFSSKYNLHVPKLVKIEKDPAISNKEILPQQKSVNHIAVANVATEKTIASNSSVQSIDEHSASIEQSFDTVNSGINTRNILNNTQAKSLMDNPYAEQISELAEPVKNTNNPLLQLDKRSTQSALTAVIEQQSNMPIREPINFDDEQSSLRDIIDIPVKYEATSITVTEPKYPLTAKRKGLELDVTVKFTIGTDGLIHDIEFQQKSKVSYFKSAIVTAMRKWRFLPAQVNGQPVESEMSKIFSFSLAS